MVWIEHLKSVTELEFDKGFHNYYFFKWQKSHDSKLFGWTEWLDDWTTEWIKWRGRISKIIMASVKCQTAHRLDV